MTREQGQEDEGQGQEHTYCVYIVMLEQRTHHGVDDHSRWDL